MLKIRTSLGVKVTGRRNFYTGNETLVFVNVIWMIRFDEDEDEEG